MLLPMCGILVKTDSTTCQQLLMLSPRVYINDRIVLFGAETILVALQGDSNNNNNNNARDVRSNSTYGYGSVQGCQFKPIGLGGYYHYCSLSCGLLSTALAHCRSYNPPLHCANPLFIFSLQDQY